MAALSANHMCSTRGVSAHPIPVATSWIGELGTLRWGLKAVGGCSICYCLQDWV